MTTRHFTPKPFLFPAEQRTACPTCAAPAGTQCRSVKDGGPAGRPHEARKLALVKMERERDEPLSGGEA